MGALCLPTPGGAAWGSGLGGAPSGGFYREGAEAGERGAENGTKRGRWASGSSSPPQLPGLALPAVWFHSQGLLKPSPMATLQNHGSCSHSHTFMGKEGILNAKRSESPRASPKPTLTHPSLTRTHF